MAERVEFLSAVHMVSCDAHRLAAFYADVLGDWVRHLEKRKDEEHDLLQRRKRVES